MEKTPPATESGEPLFDFRNISKIYPMGDDEVRALDGVDVRIDDGEFLAIIGPSGSGKSTLMHIMGFMDEPTSGTMIFDREDVSNIDEAARARVRLEKIGFVFQAFNLLPRLNVLENTTLPLLYSRMPRRKARERGLEALQLVDMEERAHHLPSQLSGGQRQRVAIARALVNRPKLVLADEPTGNLDSGNTERILELFAELHTQGRTLVLVTHENDVASKCRRTIHVRDGKIHDPPI